MIKSMLPNHQPYQSRQQPALTLNALKPWQQMRWQIMLVCVILASVPLVLVEFITLPRVIDQAEQQIFAQLDSVTELKHDQIRTWIADSYTVISILLSSPVTREIGDFLAIPTPSAQQQESINTLLRVAVEHFDEDASHVGEVQKHLFSEYLVYSPEGRILAASDPMQLGKVVTTKPYFLPSLTSDTLHPPFYPPGEEHFAIFITQRIFDDQDKLLGVLAAHCNPDILDGLMLQRAGLGKSGETYLISKEGNYFLTPSRFNGYPLIHSYRSLGIDAGLAGNNGHDIYVNYENPPQYVMGVYRWVPELHAALLSEIKEEEAMQAVALVEGTSITVAIAIALFAALLGLFFATRIAAPIRSLTQAAMQIAQGDYEQRTTITTRNEIGVLARSFESMAAQVKQLVEELEQRVAARTNDLQSALQQREQTVTELQESLAIRDQLNMTIRELSSPVLPLIDGVIVVPLIGVIDSQRAQMLMSEVLNHIKRSHAHIVIIDVTGVPIIDTQVAQALVHTATAAVLLGARPILVGIRPEMAQTLVSLGVDLKVLEPHADLHSAILLALGPYSKSR